MTDLEPYRPVSDLPAVTRDLSVAISVNDDGEQLGVGCGIAHALEFDVHLSRDKRLVISHDPRLGQGLPGQGGNHWIYPGAPRLAKRIVATLLVSSDSATSLLVSTLIVAV